MAPTNGTPNATTAPTPPIEAPRAKIGEQTLALKWDLMAEYMLSIWGIDSTQTIETYNFFEIMTPGVISDDPAIAKAPVIRRHAQRFAASIDLLAACIAHNYTRMGQDAPRPMHWAEVLSDNPDQVLAVLVALQSALGKRQPAKTPAPTPLEVVQEPQQVQ